MPQGHDIPWLPPALAFWLELPIHLVFGAVCSCGPSGFSTPALHCPFLALPTMHCEQAWVCVPAPPQSWQALAGFRLEGREPGSPQGSGVDGGESRRAAEQAVLWCCCFSETGAPFLICSELPGELLPFLVGLCIPSKVGARVRSCWYPECPTRAP